MEKRGDIGSTSKAYAQAYAQAFLTNGSLSSDMVTVNPFLGTNLKHVNTSRGLNSFAGGIYSHGCYVLPRLPL
jgi:hypothetical protein